MLSNEPDNHNNVFFGMSSGNIYIYNLDENSVSTVIIRFKLMFPDKSKDAVTDMKCNPLQMHRLIIAYEETAIIIYSLNKNREI